MSKSRSFLLPFSNYSKPSRWIISLIPTFGLMIFRSYLPAMASQTPAAFHYPAVFIASWLGGIIPGTLSTVLLSLYTLLFIKSHLLHAPLSDTVGLVRSTMFFTTSLMFVLLISALQRALKKAYEALDVRDHFLSLAAHELRTPLTILKLRLDILQMKASGSDQDFSVLNNQMQKLSILINTMLDVSMLGDEQFKITPEDCDLNEIVQDVVASILTFKEAERATITVNAEGAVTGHWDRLKLEQVVTNILLNAIKYGDKTPVTIALGKTHGHAWLTIEDEGPGIPESEREKVFQPYHRIKKNHALEGLGLGLYLSKKIVELHRGTISLETGERGGARFRIQLP